MKSEKLMAEARIFIALIYCFRFKYDHDLFVFLYCDLCTFSRFFAKKISRTIRVAQLSLYCVILLYLRLLSCFNKVTTNLAKSWATLKDSSYLKLHQFNYVTFRYSKDSSQSILVSKSFISCMCSSVTKFRVPITFHV